MLVPLPSHAHPARSSVPVVIGLVNNMPEAARQATERQFARLIEAGSPWPVVGLKFFTADPAVGHDGRPGLYGDFASMQASRLDALIVTGARPVAPDPSGEPVWPFLTRVADLALDRGIACVWSCLAAQALVLYLHGIRRVRLPAKMSGLAECVRRERHHPLLNGLPPRWRTPHSRYNDVPAAELAARGYDILSRSPECGVDAFVYDAPARFLCFQGHPEYSARTLLREYNRDVGEFLAGFRDDYPPMPSNYFPPHAAAALDWFRREALRDRRPAQLARFPVECGASLTAPWREIAISLWGNWLREVDGTRRDGARLVALGGLPH